VHSTKLECEAVSVKSVVPIIHEISEILGKVFATATSKFVFLGHTNVFFKISKRKHENLFILCG